MMFRSNAIKDILLENGKGRLGEIREAERFYMGEFLGSNKMNSGSENIPLPFDNMTVEMKWDDNYLVLHSELCKVEEGECVSISAFTDSEICGVCFLFLDKGMMTTKIPNKFYTEGLEGVESRIKRSNEVGNMFREMVSIINQSEREVVISDEVRRVKGTRKKNIKRTKYTIVRINERFISKEKKGNHASPMFHTRRGHWRKLKDRSIWVRSCTVGDKENGEIKKHYVV